jgi:hypothetical protein
VVTRIVCLQPSAFLLDFNAVDLGECLEQIESGMAAPYVMEEDELNKSQQHHLNANSASVVLEQEVHTQLSHTPPLNDQAYVILWHTFWQI